VYQSHESCQYDETDGELCHQAVRVSIAPGGFAFVGAGRRSLALFERSELANDDR